MTLSVVMPTYNGSRFLARQIDSILAQTDPDFELIAIDDGSTDDTVAILDDYARRDARIRRLSSSGNAGQRRRLVELITAASGAFVAIADQDDIWHPERNARLLRAIGERAVAFGRSQLIDADGRDLGRSILDTLRLRPDIGPLQALMQPLVSAHAAIIRRSWLDIATLHGWLEFDRAIGLEALFSIGLAYVDDAVVFHRIHGSNQHNGSVLAADSRRRLVSRHRARQSLNFVKSERLSMYLTLDQLGRSTAVAPAVARKSRALAGNCYNCWFYPFDQGTTRKGWLGAFLHDQLDEYAGSEIDLMAFRRHVALLTRSPYSSASLRAAAVRYLTVPA